MEYEKCTHLPVRKKNHRLHENEFGQGFIRRQEFPAGYVKEYQCSKSTRISYSVNQSDIQIAPSNIKASFLVFVVVVKNNCCQNQQWLQDDKL